MTSIDALRTTLSLSTCWNSHRHTDGRVLANEARELGFEAIEVSHGTKISLLPGLLEAVAKGEIRISSLHNFCPPPVEVLIDAPDVFEFTSDQITDRQRAISLTRKTIEMAARFHTDRVVLHLGCVPMRSITAKLEAMAVAGQLYSRPYIEQKLRLVEERQRLAKPYLDRVRSALDELLPHCEEHQVQLGLETRSHYEQIPNQQEMLQLLQDYADCPWIGAWHDFGHVQRQANIALLDHELYLRQIAPHLIGCHVHDVQWPARDHRTPLGAGGVPLDKLLPLVPGDVPLVWEISPSQSATSIREALRKWHIQGLRH